MTTDTFDGIAGSNWNTNDSWSLLAPPTWGEDADITANVVISQQGAVANNVTVENNKNITLNYTGNLDIGWNLYVNSGAVFNSIGQFTATNGIGINSGGYFANNGTTDSAYSMVNNGIYYANAAEFDSRTDIYIVDNVAGTFKLDGARTAGNSTLVGQTFNNYAGANMIIQGSDTGTRQDGADLDVNSITNNGTMQFVNDSTTVNPIVNGSGNIVLTNSSVDLSNGCYNTITLNGSGNVLSSDHAGHFNQDIIGFNHPGDLVIAKDFAFAQTIILGECFQNNSATITLWDGAPNHFADFKFAGNYNSSNFALVNNNGHAAVQYTP